MKIHKLYLVIFSITKLYDQLSLSRHYTNLYGLINALLYDEN